MCSIMESKRWCVESPSSLDRRCNQSGRGDAGSAFRLWIAPEVGNADAIADAEFIQRSSDHDVALRGQERDRVDYPRSGSRRGGDAGLGRLPDTIRASAAELQSAFPGTAAFGWSIAANRV